MARLWRCARGSASTQDGAEHAGGPDRFRASQPRTGRCIMPAKSAAQQKAAGAALAAKRGDMPKSRLKGASRQMADSMSEKELDKMASTKRKGKPEHVSKK